MDEDLNQKPDVVGAPFQYGTNSQPLDGFTIKRGIGRGGFGEVYHAVSDAGKEVALKLVRRNLDVELRGIRQCLNLKHPNLMAVYDIREDRHGNHWVVMDHVAGPGLDDRLATCPDGLPLEETLAWFHGTAASVAYLHDRGVVHRDLKPGNIFRDEGVVKVGDYGLSKFISCSRRSGNTESIGTVHYMAPEVANGRYGREIDIYALGIILYEMLTGRVPFEGESIGEVLMKHLTAQPDVSILPEPYRAVVARALEKDPDKRYRTVAQMLAAMPKNDCTPCFNGTDAYIGPVPADPVADPATEPILAEPATEANRYQPNTQSGPTDPNRPLSPEAQAELQRVAREYRQQQAQAQSRKCSPEPLAHAFGKWWLSITPFGRVMFVLLMVAAFMFGGIVPLVPLFFCYGIYVIVWVLVQKAQADFRGTDSELWSQQSQQTAQQNADAARKYQQSRYQQPAASHSRANSGPLRKVPHRSIEQVMTEGLGKKSIAQRTLELVGSMLISALVATVLCVVGWALFMYANGQHTLTTEHYSVLVWTVIVSTLGAWLVLIVSKFWEGADEEEPLVRRLVLGAIGLGLGAIAAGLQMLLLVDLESCCNGPLHALGRNRVRLVDAGVPTADWTQLVIFAAVFGLTLGLCRWWRLADPRRKSRIRVIWPQLAAMVVAAVVADLAGFPQPWLLAVAVTMAVAVQASASWIPMKERRLVKHD